MKLCDLELNQTVFLYDGEKRIATGTVVKRFKNAVDLACTEWNGIIGHQVQRVFTNKSYEAVIAPTR